MREMVVNGFKVKTNLHENGSFAVVKGNAGKTQTLVLAKSGESDEKLVERCARSGFKTIRVARVSTNVVGYHNTIALCRR